MADKKGRRTVLFLSELGGICCLGCILMTCELGSSPNRPAANCTMSEGLLWDKMPIHVVWINSLFRVVGGGPNVSFAIIFALAADVSTPETRLATCANICFVS
jgi:hypothetical protein